MMRARTAQTARTAHARTAQPHAARLMRLVIAALAAGAVLAFGVAAAPGGLLPDAQALGKGIVDNRLETATVNTALVPSWVQDMGAGGGGLGAKWTRILVRWATLQPKSASGWNSAYVAQLHAIVDQLRAQDISVIMTMVDVPKWASKKSLWKSPPKGYKKGAYKPFYAMDIRRSSVRSAFAEVGQFLAREYPVQYFECWNEPNLGSCLYPQKTKSDAKYGARTYLAMLRAFDTGVHRSDKKAKVIAGATAPRGGDDAYSTTPQAFAKSIKAGGGAKSCDGYSHHPYVPRGTRNIVPRGQAEQPQDGGHARQPQRAHEAVPHQAVLPDGVRLRHPRLPVLRLHRQRGDAGQIPQAGLRARGEERSRSRCCSGSWSRIGRRRARPPTTPTAPTLGSWTSRGTRSRRGRHSRE